MIGGHTEMSGAFLDHLEHGIQHADDRAEGAISSLVEAARSVEVTEQLVGAIDQVDDHARPTPPRSCHEHSRPVKMGLREGRELPGAPGARTRWYRIAGSAMMHLGRHADDGLQ